MVSFVDLHESFNARNMSPEQVAATFVPSDDFESLFQNCHIVLMGPRGSGKTTLLKMLTTRGLVAWSDNSGTDLRKGANFIAIYIPTDIHWKKQVTQALSHLSHLPQVQQKVAQCAVTTNVLSSLSQAFHEELSLSGQSDLELERILALELRHEWLLTDTAPLLSQLQHGLSKRMNQLYLWAGWAARQATEGEVWGNCPDFLDLDYFAAVKVGCSAFATRYPTIVRQKWALCFDELELAPRWLQDRLFSELRSTDEQFLFRLSTSPVPSVHGLRSAAASEDFSTIRLWPHRNKDTRAFSRNLLESRLSTMLTKSPSLEEIFGRSPFSQSEGADEYSKHSETWTVLTDVAATDEGFRDLLIRNDIDPSDPSTASPKNFDEVIRKAKPIAYFRHAFVKVDDQGRTARRTRKVYDLYHGIDVLLDISDGNPRWLTAVLSEFIPTIKDALRSRDQFDARKPLLQQEVQSQVFRRLSSQFVGFLRVLPDAEDQLAEPRYDLETLLRRIGTSFFDNVVMKKFSLNPVASFIVDERVPESTVAVLRFAAYQGAIVMVEPSQKGFETSLRGKRFRLSYLLAPEFRLPLRLYKAGALSRCLGETVDGLGNQHTLPFALKHGNEEWS